MDNNISASQVPNSTNDITGAEYHLTVLDISADQKTTTTILGLG